MIVKEIFILMCVYVHIILSKLKPDLLYFLFKIKIRILPNQLSLY